MNRLAIKNSEKLCIQATDNYFHFVAVLLIKYNSRDEYSFSAHAHEVSARKRGSVRNSTYYTSETTERISAKCGTENLHEKLSGKFNFSSYLFSIIHFLLHMKLK